MLESRIQSSEFQGSLQQEKVEKREKSKLYKLVGNLGGQNLEIYTHARDLGEAIRNAGYQLEEKHHEPKYSRIPYLKRRFLEKVIVYYQDNAESGWIRVGAGEVNKVLPWR